ncbi:MAG: hypothetical protein R3A48_23260 [Polyangiales bacterium]
MLVACAVVVVDTFTSANLIRRITWPVAVIAMFWFYGLPALLWRANACAGCGEPMPVELLAGRAPR